MDIFRSHLTEIPWINPMKESLSSKVSLALNITDLLKLIQFRLNISIYSRVRFPSIIRLGTLFLTEHTENNKIAATIGLYIMNRYDMEALQSDLRTVLGKGLTEESVQSVKDLLTRYKNDPRDWKDKEKWSDVK